MKKYLKKLGFVETRDDSRRPSDQLFWELSLPNSLLIGLKVSIRNKTSEIFISCYKELPKCDSNYVIISDHIPYTKENVKRMVKALRKLPSSIPPRSKIAIA